MHTPNLNAKEIYAIPVGHSFSLPDDRIFVIYGPLNGRISLATYEQTAEIEREASQPVSTCVAEFQASGSVPVFHIPQEVDSLNQIDLLLNHTCNFKCVYCYSAKGRNNQEVSFESIKAVVDYLFLSGRPQNTPYIINFSGGGEPLMSFPLMQRSIDYIEQVAGDYKYNIGLVTNGSLITTEMVDYFKKHRVDMAVSFEILKELQDAERGDYDRVSKNIDMMLEEGYNFGIRTTFTPASVGRMEEMVTNVSQRFPKLRSMVYDVVLAPSLFDTVQQLDNYYDTFLDGYYRSKLVAQKHGITLGSIAAELLSISRERTCQGKIVLTPTGIISSCARVSSPNEQNYDSYIYGNTEQGRIHLDSKRFRAIMNRNNIYSKPECRHCFARWNCGGGCRLFDESFQPAFQEARCRFTRKALLRQMMNVLFNHYGEDNLRQIVRNL